MILVKRGKKLIQEIINNTQLYIEGFPKEKRKDIGQFFTSLPTARYMASKVEVTESMKILDVGAGTGILSAAVLEKVLRSKKIKKITLTLYENDPKVISILRKNLRLMKEQCHTKGVQFSSRVIQQNFILANGALWKNQSYQGNFDVVISNPPYKKIGKDDMEAKTMQDLVYGQPNIYYLCMAMGSHLLKNGGQFIYIVPRSWTSGLYFKKFRKYFLNRICLKGIHLFVSRDKVFDQESVLQETIIAFGRKSDKQCPKINITTSNGTNDFHQITTLSVKSKTCITRDDNRFVLLPATKEDVEVLSVMSEFKNTLESEGYIFKTGQVVEFRSKDDIKMDYDDNCMPLIRPFHLNKGYIKFPVTVSKSQYINKGAKKSLFLNSNNTLLLKRFTTKEETRRLQTAILWKDDMDYEKIAVENHVNYLEKTQEEEINKDELYGLWALLSTKMWDRYYRILNGSTQVNATEINSIPVPAANIIKNIGKRVQYEKDPVDFDNVVKGVLYGKIRRDEIHS